MEFRSSPAESTLTPSSAPARAQELTVGSITCKLSLHGEVDSSKHTFYDFTMDPKLDELSFNQRLMLMDSYLTDLRKNGFYPYKRALQTGCKVTSVVKNPHNGKVSRMINLASNDYLNLTQHPRIKQAVVRSIEENGLGSGGSPMLSGTTSVAQQFEAEISRLKGCDRALTFSSGYSANIGIISALLRKTDLAVYDRYAHASLMDGSAGTNQAVFRHNDPSSLKFVLEKAKNKYANKLVILDGVYSMDGDIARLPEITEIAHHYGAWVLVDEAHALGVIGENGLGTMEHFGMKGKVDIVTGTMSKALGSVGGFVAGSRMMISALEAGCRSYMFSTAPFIPAMSAALEGLKVIQEEPELRHKLWNNIEYMTTQLRDMGFHLGDAQTAILPLILGDNEKVKIMTAMLNDRGVFVNGVLYPAVPRRQTRVRISLTAGLSQEDMDYALNQIREVGRTLRVIA